ncbi:LysE family translocator [Aliiglaciecola sp. 3_MG-2023]|uniref:LysE family translocator n=1 Tax=Aliiglaciecola sp. 3_MG-2023 TaxID=3062644 RepID=UPI0026E2C9AA|nr:LysE family translocator [Aliiglaciecola sp. 3_MG-2023]MDO6694658.1 LysE family translocator [Aliiglaciecola sp. 3_MG-2023]
MIPIETLLMFLAASVALSFAPGPDNIFVLTQSALNGRKAGILVTLGLCTGLFVHTAAVSFGVAVIFQTSALAFNILKIVGAVYLLYLAFQAFRAGAAGLDAKSNTQLPWRQLYSRGIIMNITNPKVAIFFLAFLPQFADPDKGSVTLQMVIFGGVFIVTALVIFSLIAWFAGYLGEWLKGSTKAQVVMNRIAGTVFSALALRLVLSER